MILTNCAYCAAPLTHTYFVHCARCYTRYCGSHCLEQDYFGTHLDHCEQIERGGGAEQYHADTKSAEAAATAIEACLVETSGQTCYICFDGGEGLVRGCSCRGGAGFAHLSCLVDQAKILVAGAEEKNLGPGALDAGMARWYSCSLCKQWYHGVVFCALGWACWKTYVGRLETDQVRGMAMNVLGNGLFAAKHHEDAMSVQDAELSLLRRVGAPEDRILTVQCNLSSTYSMLGRTEEALRMRRDVYSGTLKVLGEEHEVTFTAAGNYASILLCVKHFDEAKSLLLKTMPVARRVLGESDDTMLRMRWNYAMVLFKAPSATLDDLREAVTTLEDATRIARRVLGGAHPVATEIHYASQDAKLTLLDRQCDEMSHFNLKHSREMEVREVALGRHIAAMRIQKPILLRRWGKAYRTMLQLEAHTQATRDLDSRHVDADALKRHIAAMRIQKPILLRRWAKAYHTMAQLGRAPDVHWDRLVFP